MSPDYSPNENAEDALENELTPYWKEGILEEKLNGRPFMVRLKLLYPEVTEEKIRNFYGLDPKK